MTDQASTQQNPPSGQAPAPTTTASGVEDVAALKQRLGLLEKEAAEARKEAAKYRTRNDEETAAKLKEQGDYKALYEKATPDLEKAKRYDAWVERETKRVDDEAKTLAPHEQLALSKVASLEDRAELLGAFKAARSTSPSPPPPAGTPPPGGVPPGEKKPDLTFDALGKMSGAELDEYVRKNGQDAVARVLSTGRSPTPRPSTWRPPQKK